MRGVAMESRMHRKVPVRFGKGRGRLPHFPGAVHAYFMTLGRGPPELSPLGHACITPRLHGARGRSTILRRAIVGD